MNKGLIARVAGFLFSDGCLYINQKNNYYEVSFSLGDKRDVISLTNDLKILGYDSHFKEEEKLVKMANRNFKMHVFRVKCVSKKLFELMANLGVPVGKKTDHIYEVPNWVLSGSRDVQKQFLAGFLGGDGPKATITVVERKRKKPCNKIGINDIEFYKRIDLIEYGIVFAYQLKWLLERFGVKMRRIFCKGKFPRKNGTYSTSIHLSLSQTVESALAYCNVGFAYCVQKTNSTEPVKAFLRELHKRRMEWREIHAQALNLYNGGLSIKEVAERVGVSYDVIFGWIHYNKKPTIRQHHLKFDAWVRNYVGSKC